MKRPWRVVRISTGPWRLKVFASGFATKEAAETRLTELEAIGHKNLQVDRNPRDLLS